jgi:hypothetical protein
MEVMAVKRYVLPVAFFSTILLAFCILVFGVLFAKPYGTGRTFIAIIAHAGVWATLGIGLAIPVITSFIVATSGRKPLHPPNYPRIEHLRIAGKYQAVGRFGDIGISPLHLSR